MPTLKNKYSGTAYFIPVQIGKYISPPLIHRGYTHSKAPPGMPETEDSTKLCIYTMFSFIQFHDKVQFIP